MNKLIQIAAMAIVCAGMCSPAMAADNTATDDAVTNMALIPARILGVTAGAAVGVPVATVRATVENTVDIQKSLSKSLPDAGSPPNAIYSSVLALPGGLISGVIAGPFYGLKNAGEGFDHPFSATSFSMQDEDITR